MSWLRQFLFRLSALFRRRKLEEDMAKEIRLHLEEEQERNVAAGMSPEAARYAAQRRFGGIEQIKENARDHLRALWLENLGRDLAHGFRRLRRAPGFTFTAVITLALGIGACTTIFTIAESVLLRRLSYADPERLVAIRESHPSSFYSDSESSPGNFFEWRRRSTVFGGLAAGFFSNHNLSGSTEPVHVLGQNVTSNFFSVLGVKPAFGRDFRPEEDNPGQQDVAILAYDFWQSSFGGRQDILNQIIRLNGRPFTVIGIMPAGFETIGGVTARLWTLANFRAEDQEARGNHFIHTVIGRLQPSATVEQARAELLHIADGLATDFPETNKGWSVRLLPLSDYVSEPFKTPVWGLFGAVGCLLLIACANVANLLLARGLNRRREMAIRTAMGAGRKRILRQLLVENAILAALGGCVGILFSIGGTRILAMGSGVSEIPRLQDMEIDGGVLVFACVVTAITTVIIGIVPALRASQVNPIDALKGGRGITGGGGGSWQLRRVLVITEFALALLLLAGAALLGREFLRVQRTGPGFESQDAVVMSMFLLGERYETPPQRMAFIDAVLDRVQGLPDVQSTGVVDILPLTHYGHIPGFAIAGRPALREGERPKCFLYRITPGYLPAMRIPLREGRPLNEHDDKNAPKVVLINDELARSYFPNESPIGQRIDFSGHGDWHEIVGVVGGVKHYNPAENTQPQVYAPWAQEPNDIAFFVIRTSATSPQLPSALRSIVHEIDPQQPIAALRSLDTVVNDSLGGQRSILGLLLSFSVAALSLAAIGIYGVIAEVVSYRTNEIGIRMALGAQGSDVLKLVMIEAGRPMIVGLAIGIVGILGLDRLVRAFSESLFPGAGSFESMGITRESMVVTGVVLLLGAVGAVAALLPARRAARIDPMIALRCE